jgi:hypothetical protein
MTARPHAAIVLMLVPAFLLQTAAAVAHLFVCMAIEELIAAIDEGLTKLAAGEPTKGAAGSIAVYVNEAPQMAARFTKGDPLPDDVLDALAAMHAAASGVVTIADIAPLLPENGLMLQDAMPQICPKSEVPDLARHGP